MANYANPKMKEVTGKIRAAIVKVLRDAGRPMTSYDLSRHPDIAPFGYDPQRLSSVINQAVGRLHNDLPLATMRNPAPGPSKKLYYNTDVFDPGAVVRGAKAPAESEAAPVNEVNPHITGNPGFQFNLNPTEKFEFNPVEFESDREQKVVLPAARRVVIEVGGVKINIELA